MTKAEIVANISEKLGIEKVDVQLTVESLMKEIIDSLEINKRIIKTIDYDEKYKKMDKLY